MVLFDVRDQRFLGDERFVTEIEERVQGDREISTPTARVKLAAILPLVAKAHGATEKDLVQAGRQRKWIGARSMLVYLGREWGRVSVKELGKRLYRDPSASAGCTQLIQKLGIRKLRSPCFSNWRHNAI